MCGPGLLSRRWVPPYVPFGVGRTFNSAVMIAQMLCVAQGYWNGDGLHLMYRLVWEKLFFQEPTNKSKTWWSSHSPKADVTFRRTLFWRHPEMRYYGAKTRRLLRQLKSILQQLKAVPCGTRSLFPMAPNVAGYQQQMIQQDWENEETLFNSFRLN